jgi:hypothetical protein
MGVLSKNPTPKWPSRCRIPLEKIKTVRNSLSLGPY